MKNSIPELGKQDGNVLPATTTQRTGRSGGGRHLIYESPYAVSTRSFKEDGIDFRAAGGCIVAAPSVHPSGARYELIDVPTAPAPTWLLELAGRAPNPCLPLRVQAALRAPKTERSEKLFVVYDWGIDAQLSDEEVFQIILDHPIGSKVREKNDPHSWLTRDFERYRAKRNKSWDPRSRSTSESTSPTLRPNSAPVPN